MPKKFEPVVEWRDPNELTPYPLNNKLHPTEQIDKVAGSIAEFGCDVPLVVDSDGVIIKGHARREAALRLGLDKVPVVVRNDLSEAQKKASRIADNKTAVSDFDEQAIALEFEALKELEYDLTQTGFDTQEIDELLKLKGGVGYGGGTGKEDDVPEVDEVEPRDGLVQGSIWQLGRHRIMCGDSTDEKQVRRLLGDAGVDMVWSDPPYGINIVAANGYVGGGEAYDIPFGGVKNRKGHVGGVTATEHQLLCAKSVKPKKS
ncbi:MAG: ParB N-terminal domain-containing protein [Chroococcidiopsis sp.]